MTTPGTGDGRPWTPPSFKQQFAGIEAERDNALAEVARLREERDEARRTLIGVHRAVHGTAADLHDFPRGCPDLVIEVQELIHERDPARMVMDLVHARSFAAEDRDRAEAERDAAEAERDAMRAVVEKVGAWIAEWPPEEPLDVLVLTDSERAIYDAYAAYQATTTTPEESDG